MTVTFPKFNNTNTKELELTSFIDDDTNLPVPVTIRDLMIIACHEPGICYNRSCYAKYLVLSYSFDACKLDRCLRKKSRSCDLASIHPNLARYV